MKYDHNKIEKKWQKIWAQSEKENGAKDFGQKSKEYILVEFPYPSAAGLHVGNCMSYGASDAHARMKRMQGKNVLFPIGWDAFGLPTENYAIKTKTKPQDATAKNIGVFRTQMKQMGYSFDYDREVDTTDPDYYRWTQWIFLQFYKHAIVDGKLVEVADDDAETPRLAFQSEMPINWCPSCKIGLANEEVINGKCERCGAETEKRSQKQWMLRITAYADRLIKDLDTVQYLEKIKTSQINWIGKSTGTNIVFKLKDSGEKIEVFTTRADTLFGVTYVVLAPEHELVARLKNQSENENEIEDYIKVARGKSDLERTELQKDKTGVELKGIKAINPINDEEVSVWVADYVLANYGTGAVMAVPAHDDRDFEFATKYNIPIKQVIAPTVTDPKSPPKDGEPVVFRRAVQVILKDPKTDKVLCLKSKKFPWTTLIVGGVEEGEDIKDAAEREVLEETGYKNIKYVKTLGGIVDSNFYAQHKKENRKAHFSALVFELANDEMSEVSQEEQDAHEIQWVTWDELKNDKNLTCSEFGIWHERMNTEDKSFTEYGVLVNSGDFTGLTSEEGKKKITEKLKELGAGDFSVNYKLRDWIFSRQHYWGEPIPIIHCDKCGKAPKVLVAHGITGHNKENWFPWFKKELEARGYKVVIPNLPNTDYPTLEEWVDALGSQVEEGDKLILVGHSLGAPAICQLVNKKKLDVEKLILVAPTGPSQNESNFQNLLDVGVDEKELEIIRSFNSANTGLDEIAKLAKSRKILLSDNDPFIPLDVENDYVELDADVKIFHEKGHFNHSAGITELPEILVEFPEVATGKIIPVPEDQLPVTLPVVEKYQPTDSGESPLAGIADWVETTCPICGGKAKRETDTMPNWAGSSWYFLAYALNNNAKLKNKNTSGNIFDANSKELKYWMPVDLYNGGNEHTTLHLLYSRFWHKFLFDLGVVPGAEPYQKRIAHGIILGADGRKMSKSFGNTINPDEIIKSHGADALRMYIMFIGPYDQESAWNNDGLSGVSRFLSRVWENSLKVSDEESANLFSPINELVREVENDIENYSLNTYIAKLMTFNNLLSKEEKVNRKILSTYCQLLAPAAPHIAEEIWETIGEKGSIFQSAWPKYDASIVSSDLIKIAVQVNGKLRDVVEAEKDAAEDKVKELALGSEKVKAAIEGKEVIKVIVVPNKIVSIVIK